VDRRYNNPFRLTRYARRSVAKWFLIITAWILISSATNVPVSLFLLFGIIGWLGVRTVRIRRLRQIPRVSVPVGERNSRHIPQDVKIAVSVRDGGRCRNCDSVDDLHYDHVIPWSRGGVNTVSNIQLLCGRCNRAKGALMPQGDQSWAA